MNNKQIFIISSALMALIIIGIFIFLIKPTTPSKIKAIEAPDISGSGYNIFSKRIEKPQSE